MTDAQKEAEDFMQASPFVEYLTKREMFAAMAMQGLLAGNVTSISIDAGRYAVQYADALLAELARETA